jgi:hypothetical protein
MARVPGLVPAQDERHSRVPLRGRTPAPEAGDLRPQRLTPVATPVDTYSRPEAPDGNNNLLRLADSLAAFNPSLQRFMDTTSQVDPVDSLTAAQKFFIDNDEQTAIQKIKSGQAPELANMYGQQKMADWLVHRRMMLMSGQITEGAVNPEADDFDGWFSNQIAEDLEMIGEDRVAKSTYFSALSKGQDKLRVAFNEAKSERAKEIHSDMVYSGWVEKVRWETANGTAPMDIAKMIIDDKKSNKDFFGLTFNEQQERLLQLSSQMMMAENFDVAEALLTYEHEDGGYKGSLATSASFGAKAEAMRSQIADHRLKAANAAAAAEDEEALDGIIRAAINDGSFPLMGEATVRKPNGELHTYS